MLTRSSVHCADRMVAHTSWNGVSRSSSQSTSGYSSSSPSTIERTRAGSGGHGPRRGRRVALVTSFRTIFRMSRRTRCGYITSSAGQRMDETPEELEQIRREADAIDVYRYRKRFRFLAAIGLGAADGGAGLAGARDGRQQARSVRARARALLHAGSAGSAVQELHEHPRRREQPRCAPTSRRSASRRSSASRKKTRSTSSSAPRERRPARALTRRRSCPG